MRTASEYGIYLVAVFFIIAMVGLVLAQDSGHATVEEGPVATPEFPTVFLPVTMIIGLLGAVVMIKITNGQ